MSIESIPKFTDPAAALWSTIPIETKKLLLSNVYCGKCRRGVTITNFTGIVKAGDLLLVGLCSECRGDVSSACWETLSYEPAAATTPRP